MKLIDKDALVAEIKRLKSIQLSIFSKGESIGHCYDSLTCISVYNEILSFLDTQEVKEVDLDSDIRTYLTNHFNIYEDGVLQSKKSGLPLKTYDIIKVAKHFFELGMAVSNKAQKGEEV